MRRKCYGAAALAALVIAVPSAMAGHQPFYSANAWTGVAHSTPGYSQRTNASIETSGCLPSSVHYMLIARGTAGGIQNYAASSNGFCGPWAPPGGFYANYAKIECYLMKDGGGSLFLFKRCWAQPD